MGAKNIRAPKVPECSLEERKIPEKVPECVRGLFTVGKPYGAILADPPWHFRVRSPKGEGRSAAQHYKCMPLDEIAALPVCDLAAPDCALFVWAIDPMLPQALDLIRAWGFEYKTVAFYWQKTNRDGSPFVGMGYWTRANVEQCLLATRGTPNRLARDVRRLVIDRRREHSRKPDCVRESIERLVAGPYIELFARDQRSGWDAWGDEVGVLRGE